MAIHSCEKTLPALGRSQDSLQCVIKLCPHMPEAYRKQKDTWVKEIMGLNSQQCWKKKKKGYIIKDWDLKVGKIWQNTRLQWKIIYSKRYRVYEIQQDETFCNGIQARVMEMIQEYYPQMTRTCFTEWYPQYNKSVWYKILHLNWGISMNAISAEDCFYSQTENLRESNNIWHVNLCCYFHNQLGFHNPRCLGKVGNKLYW